MDVLTAADAGELLTLQLASWVREAHANDTLAIPVLHETVADTLAQLADPATTIWGLREDGRLVATVRIEARPDGVAYLGRLGVVPDRYGAGLGRRMLEWAEAHVPNGTRRIDLVTGIRSASNIAFYERHGYRIVDTDEGIGIVHMSKPLPGEPTSGIG